jgi:hypothetical protein
MRLVQDTTAPANGDRDPGRCAHERVDGRHLQEGEARTRREAPGASHLESRQTTGIGEQRVDPGRPGDEQRFLRRVGDPGPVHFERPDLRGQPTGARERGVCGAPAGDAENCGDGEEHGKAAAADGSGTHRQLWQRSDVFSVSNITRMG